MHKALRTDDVDRLYVSRKEGVSGLASFEDSVDSSVYGRLCKKEESRFIRTVGNRTDSMKTIDQQKNIGNNNGKKNNCLFISIRKWCNLTLEDLKLTKIDKP